MSANPSVSEVSRPTRPTPTDFADTCIGATEPLVLRGWITDWPARGWKLDRIADHWPKRTFRARENYPSGFAKEHLTLTPDELTRQLGTPHPPDVGLAWCFDIFRDAPELLADLPPPAVRESPSTYLLLLGRDTATGAHYHPLQHALLCLVHGKKRIVLHPPADSRYLYPRSILRQDFHISRVDTRAPDLQRFPRFNAARSVETTLEACDALFIPVGWWHTVYGIGTTVSVSLFWKARWRDLRFPQPGLRSLAGMLLGRNLHRLRGWSLRGRASGTRSSRFGHGE